MWRRRQLGGGSAGATGASGSILIEVVVAVLLAGVLVGELAPTLSASLERAAGVDVQASSIGTETAATSRDPWDWAPSVSSSWWEAGPVLRVGFRQRDRADEQVAGLWADGWFLGEHALDADAGLRLEGATWEGMQGRELVLRVRESDGEWGPPWRTVVPDVYGDIGGPKATPLPAAEEGGILSGQTTAVHLPWLATAVLQSSWAVRPDEAVGLGSPVFVIPSTAGLRDIALSGRIQTWLKEAGRVVDLYF
jgi:hypothetical protein